MNILRGAAASLVLAVSFSTATAAQVQTPDPNIVTVFKSPSCGCCGKWVDYMRAHGFEVAVRDMDDISSVKAMAGVPGDLQSCHTATVKGRIIEGHVPVEAVRRLLNEDNKLLGLAVPGMPAGSPGMEGPAAESYSVFGFHANGDRVTYMSVPPR